MKNIRDALVEADAADADDLRRNGDRYLGGFDTIDRAVRSEVKEIPPERAEVICTHDAFG